MEINVEYLKMSQSDRLTEPMQSTSLQRLVDEGAVYVPQALSQQQFATLRALLHVILPEAETSPTNFAAYLDTHLANAAHRDWHYTSATPNIDAYQLGLDGLDTLARTRAGFSFVELTPEIQDALLSLVATRDLAIDHLDLAIWLDNVRSNAVEIFVSDAVAGPIMQHVSGNRFSSL